MIPPLRYILAALTLGSLFVLSVYATSIRIESRMTRPEALSAEGLAPIGSEIPEVYQRQIRAAPTPAQGQNSHPVPRIQEEAHAGDSISKSD